MWQKWVGRGLVFADAILFAIEGLLGVPIGWHQPVIIALTGLVNIILSLFPVKK